MTISAKDWKNYIERMRKLSNTAAEKMQEYVQKNGFEDRDALIEYAYALVTKYGEGSAELSCEMYDALAEAVGESVASAIPAATATYGETARAINGSLLQSPSGQKINQVVDRLVKLAGADTTIKNAVRDGAEWAWIPAGDTCAFCITLASRGWQTASKKLIKGGHASHVHANCDCQFAIRFGRKGNVEGYDPQKYRDMYYAEDGSPQEKINAMRRRNYAKNKDIINAQKRALYENARQVSVDVNKKIQIERRDTINAYQVQSGKYGLYLSENAKVKQQSLDNIEKAIEKSVRAVGGTHEMPRIFVLSQEELGEGTFAAYNFSCNEMYLSEVLGNKAQTIKKQKEFGFAKPNDPASTTKHEFIHWDSAMIYKQENGLDKITDSKKYLQYINERCKMALDEVNIDESSAYEISKYAGDSFENEEYDETYTEYIVSKME